MFSPQGLDDPMERLIELVSDIGYYLTQPPQAQDVGQHGVPHDSPEKLYRLLHLIVDQSMTEKYQRVWPW